MKRSGGSILAQSVGRVDTPQMIGRVSAGYHEKGRQDSHVKRVIAVREEPNLHIVFHQSLCPG